MARAMLRNLRAQFEQTSGRDPWMWPPVPRAVVFLFTATAVAVLLWYLWLSGFRDQLEYERSREAGLRSTFSRDYAKAVNLDALKAQKEQVMEYVTLLEKQLPDQAEMAALLSEINQAGVGRGLQFELFKPAGQQVRQYYVEQPIELVVNGSYDAIGEFVSDIAHLSRIVSIGDMEITNDSKAQPNDRLVMRAIAKTYRYHSPEEVLQAGGRK